MSNTPLTDFTHEYAPAAFATLNGLFTVINSNESDSYKLSAFTLLLGKPEIVEMIEKLKEFNK